MAEIINFFKGMNDVEAGEEDSQRQLFLSGMIHVVALHGIYCAVMQQWIEVFDDAHLDSGERKTFKKKLLTIEALTILGIVWKESDLVTDEVLDRVGTEKAFHGVEITKHALAGHLGLSQSSPSTNLNSVKSVVDAATGYGLLEVSYQHEKKSILAPTLPMDNIFRKVGIEFDKIGE